LSHSVALAWLNLATASPAAAPAPADTPQAVKRLRALLPACRARYSGQPPRLPLHDAQSRGNTCYRRCRRAYVAPQRRGPVDMARQPRDASSDALAELVKRMQRT
jgi:hypothetical protein